MYTRKCPGCQKEIVHKSEYDGKRSEAAGKNCKSCCVSGKKNPFYGKKHTNESKAKIIKDRDWSKYKTEDFRQKQSKLSSGSKNSMYGKSVHALWIEKYGEDEADKRLAITKGKHSRNNSGVGNPMYGKPSPQGSGNGWKGWYKGIFFRSLRELMFMIQYDGQYKSAENLRIKYEFNGKERTYSPDFIIDDRLIEIKPIRLHNSPNNLAKIKAAKEYCETNGLTFEIVDIEIDKWLIQDSLVYIKFQRDYLQRFEEYVKKAGNGIGCSRVR